MLFCLLNLFWKIFVPSLGSQQLLIELQREIIGLNYLNLLNPLHTLANCG